jgi:hypothetical protein
MGNSLRKHKMKGEWGEILKQGRSRGRVSRLPRSDILLMHKLGQSNGFLFLFFVVLGVEPRSLRMLGI